MSLLPALSVPGSIDRVLVLGCGFTGAAVARLAQARGLSVLGTTRSEERADSLRAQGIPTAVAPSLDGHVAAWLTPTTHVVVAYPPDGITDTLVAPALAAAASVAYVSSTGVYGTLTGLIDDGTPVPTPPSPRAARILQAEDDYRAIGATVLRCPGIYGEDRGLHLRIMRGEHRIPGDGQRTLSRIHVVDLAALLLAAARVRGETFVVGDRAPAPHLEVVRHVCAAYGVALPPSVPLESVHESLRADRRVDPSRALSVLGVDLTYPSYREGMPGTPQAGPAPMLKRS